MYLVRKAPIYYRPANSNLFSAVALYKARARGQDRGDKKDRLLVYLRQILADQGPSREVVCSVVPSPSKLSNNGKFYSSHVNLHLSTASRQTTIGFLSNNKKRVIQIKVCFVQLTIKCDVVLNFIPIGLD